MAAYTANFSGFTFNQSKMRTTQTSKNIYTIPKLHSEYSS